MLTGEIAEFVFDMRTDVLPHLVRQGRFGPAVRRVRAQLAKGVPPHAVARQIASALEPPSVARAVSRKKPPFQVSRAPAWLDKAHIHRSVSGELRRLLDGPQWRMPVVDYRLLDERIAAQDMDVAEFIWAKDLAATHAFLSLWA